jgi:uncharacterized protein
MSERINNREYRKNVIKDIIKQLHEGKTVEDVKEQFDDTFQGVSASEITEAEQALIMEGLPVSEIQRLCDVHSAVFKGSIEEIHQPTDPSNIPGHPAFILNRENRRIETIIKDLVEPYLSDLSSEDNIHKLKAGLTELKKIDLHYSKKENLMFPYLEKYGITAPPQVMWGVDDEIRELLKRSIGNLEQDIEDKDKAKEDIKDLINRIQEMIFKEENILLPMLIEQLTQDEWVTIKNESGEIGYMIDNKIPDWNPTKENEKVMKEEVKEPGAVILPSGVLNVDEMVGMLNTLPFDMTFVDKDDTVKYFSQGKERVFARTKAIIGRKVSNCHPPASVHIVENIVADLKSGKKDHEDFWINMGEKFVYIRYFAVRDEKGEYLGVLEVTQDIKPIQEIEGEKRLVSE